MTGFSARRRVSHGGGGARAAVPEARMLCRRRPLRDEFCAARWTVTGRRPAAEHDLAAQHDLAFVSAITAGAYRTTACPGATRRAGSSRTTVPCRDGRAIPATAL